MTIEKSSYYLAAHTFFCLVGNYYVFLDLRSDEYLCLGRTHTDAVKDLLNGHHDVQEDPVVVRLDDSGNSDLRFVVQALLQRQLLVQDVTHGKLLMPTRVEAPLASVMEGPDKPRPRIGAEHVWNFFAASVTASKNLQWDSIERTVQAVDAHKSAHSTNAAAVNNGVITSLFEIFQTLRPYYPRPYLCLFDSLALVHFLARYDVFPQWVYGVKLEPFAAHCWVQVGDLVVNDIVDNVRDYTPIMSV